MDEDLNKDEQDFEGDESQDDPETSDVTSQTEAQADAMINGAKQQSEHENKSNRNKIIIGLIVLLLLLGGAFLIFGSSSDDSVNSEESSQEAIDQDEETEENVADEFDSIVYMHANVETSPRTLYSRPAAGGDRQDLDFNLGRQSFLMVDRDGDSYLIGTSDGKVYYGRGTTAPVEIFSATGELGSIHLDEGSNTALILERDFGDFTSVTSTVTKVNTSDVGEEVFYTDAAADLSAVLYVEDWDGTNNVMYGRRSCTQCDGYNAALIKLDAQGTETPVASPTDMEFGSYAFNSDSTKALFMQKTTYTEAEGAQYGIQGGIGGPEGAPFTLFEMDLSSGDINEVLTFGEPSDVPDTGFFNSPVAHWTDEGMRAYSYLNKLYVQNSGGSFDNYFETSQGDIVSIYRVDADELVVGARDTEGEIISYYNISTSKGAIVMETLTTTNILGVTLK